MVRNILLIIIALNLFTQIEAQAIQPIDFAESLQKIGSYDAAITEYKRHLYFSPEDNQVAEINRQIGLCYRSLGDWDNAIAIIRKAIDWQESDSLRSMYYLDLAVTNIAAGKYSAAELRLLRLSSSTPYPVVRKRAFFLLMVTYVYQGKWDYCQNALDSGLALWENNEVKAEIVSLLNDRIGKDKSPSKAKWLSTFIPGLGQLYGGHPFQALNAATINGLIVYYLYNQFASGSRVVENLYWFVTLHRFWSGNRSKAPQLILQDIVDNDAKVKKELLKSLDSIFK